MRGRHAELRQLHLGERRIRVIAAIPKHKVNRSLAARKNDAFGIRRLRQNRYHIYRRGFALRIWLNLLTHGYNLRVLQDRCRNGIWTLERVIRRKHIDS